jgi:hypothetical protein
MTEQREPCEHEWKDVKTSKKEPVFHESEPLHVSGATFQECVTCGKRRSKTFGS